MSSFTQQTFTGSNRLWWKKKRKGEVLASAIDDFKSITTDDDRQSAYRTFSRLYSNRKIPGNSSILAPYRAIWHVEGNRYTRAPYNLIEFVVDQAVSRIVKSTPYPEFVPNDANWTWTRLAENMQAWVDHVLASELHGEQSREVIRDGLIYGLGCLKIYKKPKENKVSLERIYPGDVFVDALETLYAEPRRMYHRRFASKDLVEAMFPEKAAAIRGSRFISDVDADSYGYKENVEQVEVVEGWVLESFKGAGDGKRIIFVGSAILLEEPYDRASFPIKTWTWKSDPNNRFYGKGLAEAIIGLHADVNHTIRMIERAIELVPKPIVFAEKGSKITPSKMTNLPGSIMYYSGTRPSIQVLQSVPLDMMQYKNDQIDRALQIAGLTPGLVDGGGLPARVETGAAVRAAFDTQGVPMNEQVKRYGEFVVKVANAIVASGKQIYEQDKSFRIVAPNDRGTIDEIDFSKVDTDPEANAYIIRAAPVSALSQDPAGRLSQAMTLLQAGAVTMEQFQRLVDIPDLKREANNKRAKWDNGQRIIEMILDEGEYQPPSPFLNAEQLLKDANEAYNRAEQRGVPEENLSLLRLFMRELNNIIAQREQAALLRQQGLAPGGAAPPAQVPGGTEPTGTGSTEQ